MCCSLLGASIGRAINKYTCELYPSCDRKIISVSHIYNTFFVWLNLRNNSEPLEQYFKANNQQILKDKYYFHDLTVLFGTGFVFVSRYLRKYYLMYYI